MVVAGIGIRDPPAPSASVSTWCKTLPQATSMRSMSSQILTAGLASRDITAIDDSARELQRAIHAELERRRGHVGTSTVSVFGFTEGSSRLVRYTYRSVRNYESERSEQTGVATRPAPETFETTLPTSLLEYIELVEHVRAENDAAERSEPVKIGGHLFLTPVQSGSVTIGRIHTFPGAEDHRAQMEAAAGRAGTKGRLSRRSRSPALPS